MNNLLPSTVQLHEKYDLKGSTYKRKASKHERAKNVPTLKDLDFQELHSEGLLLERDTYEALIKTLQRDCRVSQFSVQRISVIAQVYTCSEIFLIFGLLSSSLDISHIFKCVIIF